MNKLSVLEFEKEFRIDSRLLAPYFDQRHRAILEMIDKYYEYFLEFGSIAVQTQLNDSGGHPIRFYYLNEYQCYYLSTLMRNRGRVAHLKMELIKLFKDARDQLARRDIARINGKEIRRLETEAIQDFVGYAKSQGSKSADMYYMNITKMVNKIIGIEAGQRDNLDANMLAKISIAENVVQIAISDGMSAGLEYKEIYQLCKNRVELTIGVNIMVE